MDRNLILRWEMRREDYPVEIPQSRRKAALKKRIFVFLVACPDYLVRQLGLVAVDEQGTPLHLLGSSRLA